MTLPELYREFAAANRRRTYDADRDVTVAWHVVRLWVETKNTKKLPSLKSQMTKAAKASPAGQDSVMKIKSALSVISSQFGIPLRQKRKRAKR